MSREKSRTDRLSEIRRNLRTFHASGYATGGNSKTEAAIDVEYLLSLVDALFESNRMAHAFLSVVPESREKRCGVTEYELLEALWNNMKLVYNEEHLYEMF